ncbi:MAG TPA: MauE/DoxX family redox-associated membrane protein, partial [Candidatus Sumerlaeota bacterium]|nr:MauE/DoxX family redox-associated membrane protein [Candidatus Sumerlaeota bacterium]
LIWLEILCGALLVLGIWSRPAALLIAGMLCLFFVALASAVVRGLEIDCGCFGALMQGGIGWGSLARTLVLLGLAVLVFRRGPGRFALGR